MYELVFCKLFTRLSNEVIEVLQEIIHWNLDEIFTTSHTDSSPFNYKRSRSKIPPHKHVDSGFSKILNR